MIANLPTQYAWLNDLKGVPNTILRAAELLGTQEVVGKGSNKTIIDWRDELNLSGAKIEGYSDDDIPWCGLFAAIVAFRRIGSPAEVVADPLWAQNWKNYGKKVEKAGLGDILVFVRNGGGHVGFYVAEDATAYHVLGGNQSNKVCITRVAKDRCIAKRRPNYKVTPAAVCAYTVSSGGKLSTNEA